VIWHRLALALGRTIEELQATMSSTEFTDWCAYMRLEPFGYEVENWRAGMIAAAVCNTLIRSTGVGSKRQKLLHPSDFYPPTKGASKSKLTPEQRRFLEKRRRDRSRNSNS
jgi:hypothetical protein